MTNPHDRLRHHVTGAVERGEKTAIAEIKAEERRLDRHVRWKDGELGYLVCLVAQHGDDNVSRDPKTIASYFRLQASQAYKDGLYVLAACIGEAANAINCDARNDHVPDWNRAQRAIKTPFDIAP